MSSLDLLNEIINPAREQAGENIHTNSKFLLKVEDELQDQIGEKFQIGTGARPTSAYMLTKDQCMLVGISS